MSKKIILHIGAGKCGSSALQTFLSHNPVLKTHDEKVVVYTVVNRDGVLYPPKTIKKQVRTSETNYCSSVLLRNCNEATFKVNFRKSLARFNCDTLVLSCEGWRNDAQYAAALLSELKDFDVTVIMYVRPPVEWINSAWWQWGAWTNTEFHNWKTHAIQDTKWVTSIKEWQHVSFLNRLIVRVLPEDIIIDFCQLLNINAEKISMVVANQSLPDTLLRVFQQRKSLRSDPYDSKIDATLSKRLKAKGNPAWVLWPKTIESILAETKDANQELLAYFDEQTREAVLNSPEWWDSAHYNDKKTQNADGCTPNIEQLLDLLEDSLSALHKADLEITQLRKRLKDGHS